MGFLNTFFNVGKYSDKEIAEAAGLYYGLGPIDSASVSASAAKAEANVTVNVNIGEATTTGSKQYVPERAHDGEYHVIYKNKDDTSPASKTSGGKKAEAKPESPKQESKPEDQEPQKPKADKTAEKAPAQPKPVEVTGQQALAKTSDLNKKLEDAKNAILKPDTSPASTSSKKSEAKPESPKQESKPEDQEPQKPKADKTAEKAPAQPKQEKAEANPEPQKPKADKTAEKAPAQPKPVEVTGQQAAHTMNNGFDYTRFQAQPPAPDPQQSTVITSMPVMPVAVPVPIYPANYRELTPEQRCDHLVDVINRGLLPLMHNPRPGLSAEQKLEEVKKNIIFMNILDRQIGEVRIDSLLNLLASPSLKNAMNKYDSVDRANNPKLTEVPVSKYATGTQVDRFDMAFEAKLKDPKKVLVVLYSSVPNYDPIQGSWSGDLCMFTKEKEQ